MARTYTEEEAKRVFARVAARQPTAAPAAGALSLDDLEEAARAAGLDPTLVASAAAELDAPAPRRSILGAPTQVRCQRVVRGTVSDEAWERMVAAARAEFGQTGIAGQLGRTREWSVTGGRRRHQTTTRLALEPVGGDTRIVLDESAQNVALGFAIGGSVQMAMGVLFAALAMAGVESDLWFPAAMMAAFGVLFIGGSQVGLRLWHRRQERRFDALLDRLDLVARDTASADAATPVASGSAGSETSGAASRDRIRPDLLDDPDDLEASPDAPAGPDRARA